MIPNTAITDTATLANLGMLAATPENRFNFELTGTDKSFRRMFEAALTGTEMYDARGTSGVREYAAGEHSGPGESRIGDEAGGKIEFAGSVEATESIESASNSADGSAEEDTKSGGADDGTKGSGTAEAGANSGSIQSGDNDDRKSGEMGEAEEAEKAERAAGKAKSRSGVRVSRKSEKEERPDTIDEALSGDSTKVSKKAGKSGENSETDDRVAKRLRTGSADRNEAADAIAAASGETAARQDTVAQTAADGSTVDRMSPDAANAPGRKPGRFVKGGERSGSESNRDAVQAEESRAGFTNRELQMTAKRTESLEGDGKRAQETIDVDLRETPNRRSGLDRDAGNAREHAAEAEDAGKDAAKLSLSDLRTRQARIDAGTEEEEGVRITGRTPESARSHAAGGTTAARNRTFQGTLLAQLRDELNGKIVKQAGVILKDGGAGEIRLNLKPEQLGNVRIRLEVKDTVIVGRIIVENTSVREAFEQNMANLQRAFRDSGFESSGLDVQVNGGNAQGERRNGAHDRNLRFTELFEEQGTTVDLFERSAVDIMA